MVPVQISIAQQVTEEAASPRTRVRRHPERARHDREVLLSILDEGLVCHLGFVDGGSPFVIPTMYARAGDLLYVHGAPASRMLRQARAGVELCLTVTILDGLVLARSVFNHSMNYRSAVVMGRGTEVTDPEEKMLASQALVEHVCRGRWSDARHPSVKELGATVIVRLDLAEASVKVRSGAPVDQEEDLGLEVWAGEIPLRLRPLPALADQSVEGRAEMPDYALRYTRDGWTDPAG
ncbi:MAG: pyridoxamine 5'-phosphate oxidase family protein [Candidatus Nephthysia bennettiae]|uniref:Pyridoxamine 5'-phosphate oxidase family protein n=1 Tax=Candidatus Nephthysia bennettiae TaxID=3127016 RepID=A0A934KEC5_9BACT|nr:pyridoxamine 5'-phosphate oxidase family protein [Candidatus Dormibacteraeota bacterium]MBJ7614685.1 pyridoxamine 5'-phosphate oxidase family protein [Candidatus Dormibacteraeota bacterium]PZS00734.1 MAG: pyridoxamine 5'-phosphate oxidase family protein [Candidatus Dormibacteraeota bacterium]